MTNRLNISWPRILAEGTAIVVSILLAFSIQAWWEERLERNDEREQLTRLRVEFSENIRRIELRSFESEILDNCEEFFDLIEEAQERGESEIGVPPRMLVRTLTAPTFDAYTPILNGLIQSGQLELIEDHQILAHVADWDWLLRDYVSFAERARRSVDLNLFPALAVRGDIGPQLMIPMVFNDPESAQWGDEIVAIRIDDELKGIIAERWRNGRSAVSRLEAARQAAENVIAAIDATEAK